MFISAVLQAVKKGPNARGGLVWKTHAFWKVSKTRKANVRKKLLALNVVAAPLHGDSSKVSKCVGRCVNQEESREKRCTGIL